MFKKQKPKKLILDKIQDKLEILRFNDLRWRKYKHLCTLVCPFHLLFAFDWQRRPAKLLQGLYFRKNEYHTDFYKNRYPWTFYFLSVPKNSSPQKFVSVV